MMSYPRHILLYHFDPILNCDALNPFPLSKKASIANTFFSFTSHRFSLAPNNSPEENDRDSCNVTNLKIILFCNLKNKFDIASTFRFFVANPSTLGWPRAQSF